MSESYSYPFVTEQGKVICQICGKDYLIISPRHLKTHNITFDEYKLRFPEAPISSKEFNKLGKVGKDKNVFVEQELASIDEEEKKIKKMLEEEDDIPEKDVDPTIEQEIDFEKVYKERPQKDKDVCVLSKDKILDHLRAFYTNIKKDHMIQVFNIQDFLLFEFVSDFADPILKVNIEFPNTFWHNRMPYEDINRDKKLAEYGWKVIRINSRAPTFKDIQEAIERS